MRTRTLGQDLVVSAQGLGCMGMSEFYGPGDEAGSLATILWLTAPRREGQTVSVSTFLKLGIVVMPPALLLAIGAALLFG